MLSAMLCSAAASVGADRSTACTDLAPPAAACTLNPPVDAKTSSTSTPGRHLADADAIGSLIEEVAGLLAGADVGVELQAGLEEPHRAVGNTPGDHVAVLQTEGLAGLQIAGEAQHHARAAGGVEQRLDDRHEVREPDRGVELDDEHVGVAVDDEAGHAVVLAVEDSVCEVCSVGIGRERDADVEGGADRRVPPVVVDRRRLADVEDAELDRRVGVVERQRDELAIVVEDHGEIAGGRLVADRGDRLLEHPRMPGADVAERVGGDADGEALVARAGHPQQTLMQRVTGHGWNDATTPTSGATSPP